MTLSQDSADNRLKGRVRQIRAGNLFSEVDLDTAAGSVTAIMFSSWVEQMGLEVGSEAVAIVKPMDVALEKAVPGPAAMPSVPEPMPARPERPAAPPANTRRNDVSLRHLVDCFNHRYGEEGGFAGSPLSLRGKQVEGCFGGTRFTSRLRPVRLGATPQAVAGYDAAVKVEPPAGTGEEGARGLFSDQVSDIVGLDRLVRTVHLLNYLPIAHLHSEGYLFLNVHPRHVLSVPRDHGAYFEEIILGCGLSPRQVAITLAVSPAHDHRLTLLLERLKSYRSRGYATAVKFDDRAGDEFLEYFCTKFLYRHTPDFVRFDYRFFPQPSARQDDEYRRPSLLSAIRHLNTRLLIGGVNNATEAELARLLDADLVQGSYYERAGGREPGARPETTMAGLALAD